MFRRPRQGLRPSFAPSSLVLDSSDLGGQGGLVVRPRKVRSANTTHLLTAVLLVFLSALAQTNRPATTEQKSIPVAASGSPGSVDLVTEAEAFYRQDILTRPLKDTNKSCRCSQSRLRRMRV